MPQCPYCTAGWKEVEEHGRVMQDACYHCGNTGKISEGLLAQDRIEWASEILSVEMVDRLRAWADANPEGEGWSFHAAENMISVYDYTQMRRWECQDQAQKALRTLGSTALASLVDYLLDTESQSKLATFVDRTAIEKMTDTSVKEVILDRLDGKKFEVPKFEDYDD